MARKFNFRGRSLDELRSMTTEEFSRLLTSRARRYLKRASIRSKKVAEKIRKALAAQSVGKEKIVKFHERDAVIMPQWVGLKLAIHNGKTYKTIQVTEEMLGRRLGEFAHSTGPVKHSGPGVGATRGSKFIPLK